jgi:hypothetical protein
MDRGTPVQDSEVLRNGLEGYLLANHHSDYFEIASYLKQEGGLVVPHGYALATGDWCNFNEFFTKFPIGQVLTAITFIWQFLRNKYPVAPKATSEIFAALAAAEFIYSYPKADAWHAFVSRVFREDNIGYSLDEKCGVRYLIDEEFERNRVSTLKCLESDRYAGVQAAFQAAHENFARTPADTKGALRHSFEAAEIMTKFISDSGKGLVAKFVKTELEPLIQKLYAKDPEAQRSSLSAAQSFADWVDAVHVYRHGHGKEWATVPPVELTILLISQGASFIRWLVELDLGLTGGGLA